jgi:predicted O-linked N-acetylglucosamine transferase (SPINDLY family)
MGQNADALTPMQNAVALSPGNAEAHNNLGAVLNDLGRLDEAEASYRRALEIKPDFALAYSNLLFVLSYHSAERGADILALCREYDERFCLPHRGEWQGYGNSRDAHRRLRIGYVSPDFRRHAVAYFAEPILANHDKTQVEIFCYAEVMREDEYTGRFRQFADHWHSTVGMSDGAVAQMIRDHRIDILVDLAGHTAGNRLLVFARKPAPVQVTYLGYPGTTGLSAMDYRITDHYADPEGVADACYTERLLRLPDSLCCYRPSADMPEVSPLPALARGYLTFGSFNNFNKIDLPTLALWAELLHALPASRLMMLTVPEGETRLHLEQNFARLGVNSQRLEFYGKLTPAEFHRKFQEVDITLDPVSVSGGTTTCESLWMGVPVMASVGERFITRVSYSFLSTAGLADFAAFSPVDYIRLAAHLADNLPLLAEIRAGLRAHVAASPLIDEVGFTRNLELLYREAWEMWCSTN